jgi:hypothetical protein
MFSGIDYWLRKRDQIGQMRTRCASVLEMIINRIGPDHKTIPHSLEGQREKEMIGWPAGRSAESCAHHIHDTIVGFRYGSSAR